MFRFLMIAMVVAAAGCSRFQAKGVKPKVVSFKFANAQAAAAGQPRPVGRVAMVNGAGRFVIIEGGPWSPPEKDTALKCFRDGAEVGVLTAGAERRGRFVTADIVSGEIQRGDEVFE
jgi:hypothetical protein